MRITQIGFLRTGDIFTYKGRKYKTGHVINDTDGYVACTGIDTHRVRDCTLI